jgi:RNA polymerase sigma-70 factor (ECF subfamily)
MRKLEPLSNDGHDIPAVEPEADLIARVRAGDTAAFEALMRRYNQRLFRVVRSLLRDDAEAEDAVQQAYLVAFERLSTFEARSSFGSWLTRIAVREAFARVRRSRMASDADTIYAAERNASAGAEPSELASGRELASALEAAVAVLPPSQRAVLVLRTIEGLDLRECAECLGVSEGVVKIRLHRARAALRRLLERELAGAGAFRAFHRFDGVRCDRIVAGVLRRVGPSPA